MGSSPDSSTLWLRSTKFGDDQDRVLRRQDGRLTYIASDVAYHKDKFNRPANADKLITVLGPDHHGYIGRLHAVVAALLMEPSNNADAAPMTDLEAKLYGSPAERDACQAALALSKEKLEVVIFQLVRFMKDGKPAPMRKRDGNIYALIDLVDEIGRTVKPNASKEEQQEVGKDVARFFYLMRSHDTTFDFDLDLAERQSDENPVFYVQYAHARICSVIAKAAEAGLTADTLTEYLTHPKELALIKMISDLPYEVSRAAEDYGVHRLATYAIDLARAYHHFYDACRVIQADQVELSRARLALCEATRSALRSTFKLLGISAPERMDRAEATPA
jgi:arginyl-tRNA synthetase